MQAASSGLLLTVHEPSELTPAINSLNLGLGYDGGGVFLLTSVSFDFSYEI